MRQHAAEIIAFFIIVLFCHVPNSLAGTCSSLPDFQAMDTNFLTYLASLTKSKNDKVVLMPFFDNEAGTPDPVFSAGIPFLIYEEFAPASLNFMHPYLAFSVVNELGLSGAQLIEKDSVQKVADKLSAHYVVFGNYQLSADKTLRVTLNIYDRQKDQMLAPAEMFKADLNDSFFDLLNKHVMTGFSRLAKHKHLRTSGTKTLSQLAFRYYSKGLLLADSYQMSDLEMAALWFEKALQEEHHQYDVAALALARAHFMMALIQKLSHLDYSQHWVQGQKALTYVPHGAYKRSVTQAQVYRFVEGQNIAAQALTAYVVKNHSRAHMQAMKGLSFVPEDGILQNVFQTTLGDKKPILLNMVNNPICF